MNALLNALEWVRTLVMDRAGYFPLVVIHPARGGAWSIDFMGDSWMTYNLFPQTQRIDRNEDGTPRRIALYKTWPRPIFLRGGFWAHFPDNRRPEDCCDWRGDSY